MTPEDLAGLVVAIAALCGIPVGALIVAERHRRRPQTWDLLDVLLAFLALFWVSAGVSLVALRAGAGEWFPEEPPTDLILIGTAIGGLASTAVCLIRARPAGLGLRRTTARWIGLGAAFVLPFLLLSAGWVELLGQLELEVAEQPLLRDIREGAAVTGLMLVVYAVLFAPITEEILFRGFLLPPLVRWLGRWPAIWISAGVFGLLHGAIAALIPLTGLGVILAWIRLRSRSLWPAIVLHLLNNVVAVGMAALPEESASSCSTPCVDQVGHEVGQVLVAEVLVAGHLVFSIEDHLQQLLLAGIGDVVGDSDARSPAAVHAVTASAVGHVDRLP